MGVVFVRVESEYYGLKDEGSATDGHGCHMQDEFRFYMQDAASKLLLLPVKGNAQAEKAASGLNIPTASMSLSMTAGEKACRAGRS
jgi:hypothetical protein